MLSIGKPLDSASFPLGERRGFSDLARFALDLTQAPKRAEPSVSAPSRAYPSPPMSGSQPLPPTAILEAGGRGQVVGGYSAAQAHDVYRGPPTHYSPNQPRGPPIMTSTYPIPYSHEPAERIQYVYPRPEDLSSRPITYPAQAAPAILQQQNYMSAAAPGPSTAYSAPARSSTTDHPQMTSPKSQRKTKGHVASACVPCKRAHLRCDAQRPCSRCLSNGKDESCIDVQHKKRGRPRLRDDRDTRYDPSRLPHHPQEAAMRRPMNIYPSSGSTSSGYEDPLRRMQSHRVLKSQPSEPIASSRYIERGPLSDANVYGTPMSITTQHLEAVAFLDMKMDFAKVSPTFADALGGVNLQGRNLTDVVVPTERDRVSGLRGQLFDEQMRKEPNYLPPILARIDHIAQGLGFTAEDIARFQLDRQEYLNFVGPDDQPRLYPIRIGLAKEGSIYFVVMLLVLQAPTRYPYPSPSPHLRDSTQSYLSQPITPQSAYGQHTPVSASLDPSRRYSEIMAPRPASVAASGQMLPNLGPAMPPSGVSYASSSNRPEYSGPPTYQIPRSELGQTNRMAVQPSYQLPPIRAQPEHGMQSRDAGRVYEERSGRVDIGGLIDRPNHSSRPQ